MVETMSRRVKQVLQTDNYGSYYLILRISTANGSPSSCMNLMVIRLEPHTDADVEVSHRIAVHSNVSWSETVVVSELVCGSGLGIIPVCGSAVCLLNTR